MSKLRFIIIGVLITALSVQCETDSLVQDVPHNQDPNLDWGKNPPPDIVANYYYQGKIDSTLLTLQDGIGSVVNVFSERLVTPCDSADSLFEIRTQFVDTISNEILTIKLFSCVNDSIDTLLARFDFLRTGVYSFGSSSRVFPQEGVEISWQDADGTVWKSQPGSGFDSRSSFEITNLDTIYFDTLYSEYFMEGRMKAWLYANSVEYVPMEFSDFKAKIPAYK
ncbi:MAG TPA: hypothetical protein DDX92_05215 [Flavobacteriales bacterium]|jgi:hypothetical protein|nr:hypothetical protein [Flavobacteriales bacterium]